MQAHNHLRIVTDTFADNSRGADSNAATVAKQEASPAADSALRPQTFDDYTGQKPVIANLRTAVSSAKVRRDALDHVLISGPPGLGKTTLATIIANEMGGTLTVTSAPSISHKGELAAMLTQLGEGDLLFIDEIHRLSVPLQEMLYTAMEDRRVDLFMGKGKTGKAISVKLPKFTLIGATTHAGMLTGPMRDRFGLVCQLRFYELADMVSIVARSARILGIDLESDAAVEIARRSRGTPRIANRLIRRVRDYAIEAAYEGAMVVYGARPRDPGIVIVTWAAAAAALDAQGVDSAGLDATDRAYLIQLVQAGSAMGIEALAAALSAPRATLEEVVEPFLLQVMMIRRSRHGRLITDIGKDHLAAANTSDDR